MALLSPSCPRAFARLSQSLGLVRMTSGVATVHPCAMNLLLVEDDADLALALSRVLCKRGFEVQTVGDGIDALSLLNKRQFDVVLLDLSIPGMDGLQLLTRLRGRGDKTPVLVLTARGGVGDRVSGLNAGADDYLAKPFDLDELEARIRALLRRSQGEAQVSCGHLRWQRSSGVFYRHATPLDLGPREHALLVALMSPPGHAVTRDRLYRLVFQGDAVVQIEALEVVVHRLRKKLQHAGVELMTLRGLGYLLRDDLQGVAP